MTASELDLGKRVTPLSVLVADDLAEIQQLVNHWLTDLGCTVTCVSNGREASEVIRRTPIDLLITDIIMPDRDGLEVIAEIRRVQPQARVLAISGGGVHLYAGDCLRIAKSLGARAVLMKPFNRQQLHHAINMAMSENAQPND